LKKITIILYHENVFFYLQKIVKPSAAAPSPAASRPRDEIYIDDDSNEGSGGHGGVSSPLPHIN